MTTAHLRGNAAFVLARLGDSRGFPTIARSLQTAPRARLARASLERSGTCQEQIRADRYYAAHLFGDLKDARGVPLLIPLRTTTMSIPSCHGRWPRLAIAARSGRCWKCSGATRLQGECGRFSPSKP